MAPHAQSFRKPRYGGRPKMIRVGSTAGSRQSISVRRILLTSCAVVVAAGMMLLASPVGGPKPARAQFGFGGFHISIGGWRRGHRSSRYARHHRRHHKGREDDTPEQDIGRAPSATPASTPASTPAATPAPDTGRPAVRPASATGATPPSARPDLQGPDVEPSK